MMAVWDRSWRAFMLLGLTVWALAASGTVGRAELPFADGERVLFVGDSITQDGRYVALTEAYLWAAYPDRNIDVVNAGLSSETVSGITEPVHPYPRPNVHDRLAQALELTKPDWVVVCYGMNDGIYHPLSESIAEAYRDGLAKLIADVAAVDAKLILLTPPSFDADAPAVRKRLGEVTESEPHGYRNPFPQYDETLEQLGGIVKEFTSHAAVERVIDLHAVTDGYLSRIKAKLPDYAYGDGVHPPADGHFAIAVGLLAGLGGDIDKVSATLSHLTGLAAADRVGEPTAEQAAFYDGLLERFRRRSAAYRKAIGVPEPMKLEAPPLETVEPWAAERLVALRALVADSGASESSSAAVYQPYAEAAEKRWANAIAELEALDRTETHPDDAILFLGSSSVRLWDDIASDMGPYHPIRRGYGGARFTDTAVFAERLIKPHVYAAMVVFVANDVTGRESDTPLDEIERLVRHIIEVSRNHQPDAPVLLVEITPCSSRWDAWPKIRAVNYLLREITFTVPNTYFVETAEYYLDAENRPIDDYFRKDLLHQNAAGYRLWGKLIQRRLGEALRADGKAGLLPDDRG